MFAIEALNTRGDRWFARIDRHSLRWTDEMGRVRTFDTTEQAKAWLKRRSHSGLGTRVTRIGVCH